MRIKGRAATVAARCCAIIGAVILIAVEAQGQETGAERRPGVLPFNSRFGHNAVDTATVTRRLNRAPPLPFKKVTDRGGIGAATGKSSSLTRVVKTGKALRTPDGRTVALVTPEDVIFRADDASLTFPKADAGIPPKPRSRNWTPSKGNPSNLRVTPKGANGQVRSIKEFLKGELEEFLLELAEEFLLSFLGEPLAIRGRVPLNARTGGVSLAFGDRLHLFSTPMAGYLVNGGRPALVGIY